MDWTDIHQSALEILIDLMTSAPVMAYPDFQKPFTLHTDASRDRLGSGCWVSALTGDHNVLPHDPVRIDQFTVPVIDIKSAQASDQVVR